MELLEELRGLFQEIAEDDDSWEPISNHEIWVKKFYLLYKEPDTPIPVFGDTLLLDLPKVVLDALLKKLRIVDLFWFAQSSDEARDLVKEVTQKMTAEMEIRFVENFGAENQIKMTFGDRKLKFNFDPMTDGFDGLDGFRVTNIGKGRIIWDAAHSKPRCQYLRAGNVAWAAGHVFYELLNLFPKTVITTVAISLSMLTNVDEFFPRDQVHTCTKMAISGYSYEVGRINGAKWLMDKFRTEKCLIINNSPPKGFIHERMTGVDHLVINYGPWVNRQTLLSLNSEEINIMHSLATMAQKDNPTLTSDDLNAFIKHWLAGGCSKLEHLQIKMPYSYAFNESELFAGVERAPIDANRRAASFNKTRWYRCPVTCENAVDILREDGKLASIVFGKSCPCPDRPPQFHFIVWHDRFMPEVANYNRMTDFEETHEILMDMTNYSCNR